MSAVPETARAAGREALTASVDLDLSDALAAICRAVRPHTRVLPELIESSGDGVRVRRIFWPGDQKSNPSQSLF